MSHTPERQFPDSLSQVYSRLNQLDVEQFYSGYQWWITHRRINALQEEIDTLRLQIDENVEYMQHVRPPAVALATLARLQANGVDDLDLLDRMLEQGEEWLDIIMQRLDYCEQLDFLHDNYTQWCEHALEGAYDWIDSIRDASIDASLSLEAASDIEATEELLLRKLTSEEEGEIPTSEDIQEQIAEVAELEVTVATEAEDAVDLLAASMMQESEQQLMELAPVPEVQVIVPEAEILEPTTAVEQMMEEQRTEAAQALEATYVAEENGPSAASFEREGERQSVELALQLETSPSTEVYIDLASVSSEQDDAQQLVDPLETPEAVVPTDVDAAEAVIVSSEQVLEQQAVTSPSTLEASLIPEENAEVDTLEVLTNDVVSEEDTGVDAPQEIPFPIEIDTAAIDGEPLSTEIDEQDTTSETHSEGQEAEVGSAGRPQWSPLHFRDVGAGLAPALQQVLPDEVNVEGEEPVAEKLNSAVVESVEESPVVTDVPEESAPEESVSGVNTEHAPVQDQTPKRRRSFWEFLLGLPGH